MFAGLAWLVFSMEGAMMISFTWLSLPPDILRRMTTHDTARETGGSRHERIGALAAVFVVIVLALIAALVPL